MSDNILRSQNVQPRTSYNPNPTPSVRQDNSSHPLVPTKTMVGDKRLQRQEANKGNLDPFMMTTLQGDYNPAQRNKAQEPAPQQSNYVSTAPGVYQSSAQINKPVSSGPTVIVKEAALTSAPLRSQMEKEKSSLVPINVLKKKAAPPAPKQPEKEELLPKVSQPPVSEIGIRNVTNVPMPSFSFAPTPVQQKPPQNDALSAFLSEISKLEEDS